MKVDQHAATARRITLSVSIKRCLHISEWCLSIIALTFVCVDLIEQAGKGYSTRSRQVAAD